MFCSRRFQSLSVSDVLQQFWNVFTYSIIDNEAWWGCEMFLHTGIHLSKSHSFIILNTCSTWAVTVPPKETHELAWWYLKVPQQGNHPMSARQTKWIACTWIASKPSLGSQEPINAASKPTPLRPPPQIKPGPDNHPLASFSNEKRKVTQCELHSSETSSKQEKLLYA